MKKYPACKELSNTAAAVADESITYKTRQFCVVGFEKEKKNLFTFT